MSCSRGEEAFEDGTLNYLSLPAVVIGLRHLMMIGMDAIHERIRCLTGWLLEALLSLRHSNGTPLVQIYGPHTNHQRGGTIALNFLDPHGTIVDERVVEQRANTFRLSLPTGCFCNPGAGEAAFHLSQETLRKIFHEEAKEALPKLLQGEGSVSWDALLTDLGMQSGGAVRISLGLVTNFADVYRTVQFARTFLDTFPAEGDLPLRLHC
jgi:molybdenum cofactor sulfurtransferase